MTDYPIIPLSLAKIELTLSRCGTRRLEAWDRFQCLARLNAPKCPPSFLHWWRQETERYVSIAPLNANDRKIHDTWLKGTNIITIYINVQR